MHKITSFSKFERNAAAYSSIPISVKIVFKTYGKMVDATAKITFFMGSTSLITIIQ